MEQIERYFLVGCEEFAVVPAALDEYERVDLREHRWWSVTEIDRASGRETFVPRRLGELLPPILAGEVPTLPIDIGV